MPSFFFYLLLYRIIIAERKKFSWILLGKNLTWKFLIYCSIECRLNAEYTANNSRYRRVMWNAHKIDVWTCLFSVVCILMFAMFIIEYKIHTTTFHEFLMLFLSWSCTCISHICFGTQTFLRKMHCLSLWMLAQWLLNGWMENRRNECLISLEKGVWR